MKELQRFHGGGPKPNRPDRKDYEKFKEKYADLINRPGDGSGVGSVDVSEKDVS